MGNKRACHYRARTTGRTLHLSNHCFLLCREAGRANRTNGRLLKQLVCDGFSDAGVDGSYGNIVSTAAGGSGWWGCKSRFGTVVVMMMDGGTVVIMMTEVGAMMSLLRRV